MEYYVGIDIGGTNLRAGLLDEEYNLIDKFKIQNEVVKGPDYNLNILTAGIKSRWSEKEIKGIGVGCPGPLNIKEGIILETPNLKEWKNFNLKKWLENYFKLPVDVNNDANVAAYSEAMVGVGKGTESLYYITLSTGVGGGYVYKQEIVAGFNSVAAEVGNMIINEDKYKHSNMNYGGLEGQCSGVNIGRIASLETGRKVTTKEVFEGAKEGNEVFKNILNRWIVNVSKAIANIIITVDPEVIVLGGSVILNNSEYLQDIILEVKKLTYEGVNINIKLAKIGDDTGLIGAGILGKRIKESLQG